MKRLIFFVVPFGMIVALSACGERNDGVDSGSDEDEPKDTETETDTKEDATSNRRL